MTSISSPTIAQDNLLASAGENSLRLSESTEARPVDFAPPPPSYSSLHQTAVTLVTVASRQAINRAGKSAPDVDSRAGESLNDRRELALQRANAEQARRYAECSRAALNALTQFTTQPCFAISESGLIVQWNDAMAQWSGSSAAVAQSKSLSEIFTIESAAEIDSAFLALRARDEESEAAVVKPANVLDGDFHLIAGGSARRVVLVPQFRISRALESVLVLVTPSPHLSP